uniref:(northern house mosquito) hypothetical protein n=1 Tax=Culex pipiens TaxID=7175 RepID=A0A8D8BUZ4_CULPI
MKIIFSVFRFDQIVEIYSILWTFVFNLSKLLPGFTSNTAPDNDVIKNAYISNVTPQVETFGLVINKLPEHRHCQQLCLVEMPQDCSSYSFGVVFGSTFMVPLLIDFVGFVHLLRDRFVCLFFHFPSPTTCESKSHVQRR